MTRHDQQVRRTQRRDKEQLRRAALAQLQQDRKQP